MDEATFDADVARIQGLTDDEAEQFDLRLCQARMETRDGNGVRVSEERMRGFGRDIFGIAYDGASGMWSATNELGLHAHCEEHLRYGIEVAKGTSFRPEIISGFIFRVEGFETPIMTPFGFFFLSSTAIRKAIEDLWGWKRFIIVDSVEVAPNRHRWQQLFTPEHAVRSVYKGNEA